MNSLSPASPSFKQTPLLTIALWFTLAVPFLLILGRGYSDGAMGIVSILFVCQSLKSKDWSWLNTRWFVISTIACIYMVVSGLFAKYDPGAAVLNSALWFRFPLFGIACSTWVVTHDKFQRYLLPMLVILLVACSIDTIVQFLTGTSLTGHQLPFKQGRLNGPFHDRLLIGTYLVRLIWPAAGLFLAYAMEHKKRVNTYLLLAGFLGLVAFTILISGERAALLLFLLAAFVFALSAKNLRKFLLPTIAAIAVLGVIVVASVTTLRLRIVNETIPILQNIGNSSYGMVWHNAYVAWQSSPVIGIGMDNFVPMCKKLGKSAGFKNEVASWDKLRCVRHPHNYYLEWLTLLGVVGFGFFLAMIFAWGAQIKRILQETKADIPTYYLQLGFAVGLIPFLWPFLPTLSFFSNWNAVLFWWVLGLALSQNRPTIEIAK